MEAKIEKASTTGPLHWTMRIRYGGFLFHSTAERPYDGHAGDAFQLANELLTSSRAVRWVEFTSHEVNPATGLRHWYRLGRES